MYHKARPMNTSHDGGLSTGHANSSFDVLSQLEIVIFIVEFLLLFVLRQKHQVERQWG